MSLLRRAFLPFAQRFVAGETQTSAIRHAAALNEDRITALVDLLGEHVEKEAEAAAARDAYLSLLDQFDEAGVDACLSVKPTHLGMDVSYACCAGMLRELVAAAAERGRFVWIDMESSAHTQQTIDLYTSLRNEYDNIGICIQAYLKRSAADITYLLNHDGIIRLVKGAYSEPAEIAYPDKKDVDNNFRSLAARLFEEADEFAIATHDEDLVQYTKQLAQQHDRSQHTFEYQFLMGVKNQLKRELASDGYRVAEYVPYGPEWLAYFYRRVRERQENLRFAVRAVLNV